MKKIIISLIVLSSLFAFATAQDMTNIENYRIYKMSEFLELTPEQAEAFFPLLRQYEKNISGIAEQENTLYESLKARKGKEEISSEELQQIMNQVNQFEMKRVELKQQFMKQTGKMLSPGQSSRVPFFEKEFRKDLQREFIQRKNQGKTKTPRKPLFKGRK